MHPQSVVHGMVEFRDGSVVAQLGAPDMRIPIAHCLAWPERLDGPAQRLDLATVRELTFEDARSRSFPRARPGAPGDGDGRRGADRARTRPTRSQSPNSSPAASHFSAFRRWSRRRSRRPPAVASSRSRTRSRPRSPLTIIRENLARGLLPEIAVKAF